jgi:acetyl esterase/lipase
VPAPKLSPASRRRQREAAPGCGTSALRPRRRVARAARITVAMVTLLFPTLLLVLVLLALVPEAATQPAAQVLYKHPTFRVKNTTNVRYAQGLNCTNGIFPGTNCTPMDLLLDVYEPVGSSSVYPVPNLKPAYILSHGGGNSGGAKEEYCFQSSASFMTSRGFVAFNIDYRLLHNHGLLPPSEPPPGSSPPPVPTGARLISHVGRSVYDFSPHPERQLAAHPRAHEGPLTLPGVGGTQVCISPGEVAADGRRALVMEPCEPTASAAQTWKFEHWNSQPQPVVHAQSGLCLDISGATSKAVAGLPIVVAPCVKDHEDETHAQLWQLGWSGALITRSAQMSVSIEVYNNETLADTEGTNAFKSAGTGSELREWVPRWASSYPAVRDLKAAIRFVRANAQKYGVDPSRVVVSGGSAGATNSVAAGITFDEDYNKELTVAQDPTLATTHQDQNSSVQCVVAHWSTDLEAKLPQMIDPANRSRFTAANSPIVEFHGSVDSTINISHALDAQAHYAQTGVPYKLHILQGCSHAAWCYNGTTVNGRAVCRCAGGNAGYDDTMDTMALPFVATQLKLPLI